MTISSFSRLFLTCCVLALLIGIMGGCASNYPNGQSWNPSSWFGGNVAQNNANSQITPGHGPGANPPPPAPAPRLPVQANPLTVTTTLSTAPAPAKIKVAILLPLTGKNAALGQAMLNAAQQAVFDAADTRFELMPRDTAAGGEAAATAARDAVASGAQLLIGPLFAADIPAVRAVAQASNINMLTLSTDTSLAGPGVFVMGFTPGPQVERVVAFAASHGLRHFAALLPDNAYGALIGPIFQEAVTRNGGSVTAIESYDPARHDSEAHIRNLAAHRDDINALFLPEGGGDLALIAGQLAGAGFDSRNVRLLGTGLWDVPALAKQAPFLASGWYAASDPAARQAFIKAYTAAYAQEPPRLATLGYDATALAAVLAKRGARFDSADLTNPNGFAGLDGIFRLTPDGFVERGLAVNEVDSAQSPAGAHVIDAAPRSFAK